MTFPIPDQLRESKERWWVIFSNASLIATLVGLGVGLFVRFLFVVFGLKILGTVLCGVCVVTGFLLFTIPIPRTNVLGGGGLMIGEALYKKILHKRTAGVYITIWKEEEEDDGEDATDDGAKDGD